MIIKRALLLATAYLLIFMFACGKISDSIDSEKSSALEGAHQRYVFSQVLVPATNQQRQDYSLDLGSTGSSALDGNTDNKLGNAFVMLANLGIPLQPTVTTAVDRGVILVLADLQTTDFINAAEAGLRVLGGANPQPPPCAGNDDKICRHHLDGNGTFTVDPGAPANEVVTGPIVNGTFTAGPAGLSLPLVLGSLAPFTLSLTNARVKATAISDTGMTTVIGGLLRVSQINDTILPAIYPQLAVIIDRDCPVEGRKPPGCNCTGAGAQIMQVFDNAPKDCAISLHEFTSNQSLNDALRPDVCSADSCPTGAPDTISFGFQVQTVKATFPLGGGDPNLPPDPVTVAPALDRTVATPLLASTSFLYTGDQPIQTGVDPATIDVRRVAVLRGRVRGRDGAAVTGATVTVLDHPEFGQTLTRADGAYDLATNGGGSLVVVIRKDGFLQAQRVIDVPWQDYVPIPEVVLVRIDPLATPVALGGTAIEVVRGGTESDASGTRRATLLFAPGTIATVATDTGSEQLSTLTVHLTELTVGPTGPAAMPGSLPPTSAYTYALEVTVDEANGSPVELSQPALLYVENFLGFAPGTGMPVGTYDRDQGAWRGVPNGRVLKILSITGGAADLDTDGDGAADSPETLAALGVTDQERQTLATLYSAGQTLWRSPVPHFSLVDCNRPFRLPPDARFPNLRDPRAPDGQAVDDGCKDGGSIIHCHNQSLGQAIPINGTPYFLHYQSDRQAGRLTDYSTDIALSDDHMPASVTGITLDVEIAGQTFHRSFLAIPNQHTVFTWDGKDGYGRKVQGRATASISVAYVYQPSYADSVPIGNQFAQYPALVDFEPSPIPGREQVTLTQRFKLQLGPFDALPLGLGGFMLGVQHNYDVSGHILYAGGGETRGATTLGKTVLNQAALTTTPSLGGDEFPTRLRPNGGYYTVDPQNRVVRNEGGQIVAGVLGQPCNFAGDGGPATQARLCSPNSIATGPDGSLYIAGNDGRIRRVTPDGIIRTIAGVAHQSGPLFQCAPSGIGGPALQANLCAPHQMIIARDGALYFADLVHAAAAQIFKLGVDGTLSLIAGTGVAGFSGDGGPASQAMISADVGLAIDPDGNLIVAERGTFRVRRIATDGVITTIAGTGDVGDSGDGGPATSAAFKHVSSVAVAADGSIYVADSGARRYRVISSQGTISALAGDGRLPLPSGGDGDPPRDNLPPTDASFLIPTFVAAGPEGAVYVGESADPPRMFRVARALPSVSVTDQVIPSSDGAVLFVFDSSGRHLRTVDATTGAVRLRFAYDAGRLTSVTDVNGQVTQIERNAAGDPTAIIAPFGQRTTLARNQDGYLSTITDPAGGRFAFTYGSGGLMSTYTDPLGGVHHFTYDPVGRLTADKDPSNSTKTLSRTGDTDDSTVTMTSELGRAMRYRIQRSTTGDEVWENTLTDGTKIRIQRKPDGSSTATYPDGTTSTQTLGPDPRFGMLSPFATSLTLTTPGGLVQTQTTSRLARFEDAADPTTLHSTTETFTVNGKAFTRTYDAATRIVTIRSPLGRQSTATIDAQGRIASIAGRSATPVQLAFDSQGRTTSMTYGARQRTVTYGADGRAQTQSDGLAHTVQYDRDLLGRVVTMHWPDGGANSDAFDAAGNVTGVTPPGAASHSFEHDIAGQVTAYVAPDAGANTRRTTYAYNLDHQPTAITMPDGASVSLGYDAGGRPSQVTFPDGAITMTYGTSGQVSAVTAPGGVGLAFSYDGSLVTNVAWTGPVHGAIHFGFDNNFRIVSESVNGEPPIAARYDDDGLGTGVGALTITRDPATGRMTQTTIGSVTETYTVDALGDLASTATTCSGTALHSIALTRDAVGSIVTKTETRLGQTTTATYDRDVKGRLTSVNDGTHTATYTYDANGNRLSAARPDVVSDTYDAQDRLVQHGATTYTYTARGHLSTTTDASGTTSYHYDLLGNLRSVQLPTGHSLGYVIDGVHRRIGKTIDGTLTQGLLYGSGTGVVAELDGTGAVVSRFFYGSHPNVPDYMVKGGATYRIISDHLGSPRLVVNVASCDVVQQIDYDEFGRVITDSNPGFQPFGFAGGLYDRDTGLIRFGARDYDPEIGRWTAKDPLGFDAGDTNRYAYVANDPIDFIDPSGLSAGRVASNVSAGFGDMISFGFTKWVRHKLGIDGGVNPCSGWYKAGGVAAVATVVVLSAGLGGAAEAGAGAAEEGVALASRGIVRDVVGETAGEIEAGYDGVFMATTNEAGGTVWTSLGPVTQADFASLVEGAVLEGSEVNIITGAHGLANGTTQAALQFYEADVAAFGAMPGVNVLNINAMSASAIAEVAAAPATTIGALCYSAACLAPLL